MTQAIWFLVGVFVGFDVAMFYAWRMIRRARGHTSPVTERVRPYLVRRWPW